MSKMYRVKAIEVCSYPSGPRSMYRKIGDEFSITDKAHFSKRCMQAIGWKPAAVKAVPAKIAKMPVELLARQVVALDEVDLKKFKELTALESVDILENGGPVKLDLERLREVLTNLDSTVEGNWTQEGKPRVSVLSRLMGYDIAADDIVSAYPEFDLTLSKELAAAKLEAELETEAAKKAAAEEEEKED